jgi:hypothetical protein
VFYLNGSGKLGGPIATDFEAQVGAIAGTHVSNFAFRHFAEYVCYFQMPLAFHIVETLAFESNKPWHAPPMDQRDEHSSEGGQIRHFTKAA